MSKRTGLGKGLGAFFGDDYDISQTKPRAPEAVNEEIRTGTPEEPADHADKKANLEEMDMVLPVAKKTEKKQEEAKSTKKSAHAQECKSSASCKKAEKK